MIFQQYSYTGLNFDIERGTWCTWHWYSKGTNQRYFREMRFEDEEHDRSQMMIADEQLKILVEADTRKTS